MLIFEVENSEPVDTAKLMALVNLLAGRANDTDSTKQISLAAFANAAKKIGINISGNEEEISNLIDNPPLSNLLLPYEPGSNVIKFKGNNDPGDQTMPVNQAEQIVAANAKSAMKNFGK